MEVLEVSSLKAAGFWILLFSWATWDPISSAFLQLKIQSSMLQTPHVYTFHLVGIWRNPLPCLGIGLPNFQAWHSPNASIFKPSNGWFACSKKEIRRFETGKRHKFCHCLANRNVKLLVCDRQAVWRMVAFNCFWRLGLTIRLCDFVLHGRNDCSKHHQYESQKHAKTVI